MGKNKGLYEKIMEQERLEAMIVVSSKPNGVNDLGSI